MTEILERKLVVREAQAKQYIEQRISNAAQDLNRRNDIAMQVELSNEVLSRFITRLYERDEDNVFIAIDRRTYRILLAVPWGENGWKYGGLRRNEARILSHILMQRTQADAPLFDFADRQWFLNVGSYRSKEAALAYLEAKPISRKEWRLELERVRRK